MPIDPAGTTPGVIPEKKEPEKVSMRCRQPNCDSMWHEKIEIESVPGDHLFRCCKCGNTFRINVGGKFIY